MMRGKLSQERTNSIPGFFVADFRHDSVPTDPVDGWTRFPQSTIGGCMDLEDRVSRLENEVVIL